MQGVDWVLAAGCLVLAMAAGPVWAGDGAIEAADGGAALQDTAPDEAAAGAPVKGMRIHWNPDTGALAPADAKHRAPLVLPRPDYGSVRPRVTARGHLEIPATVRMATVARLGADGMLQLDCLQHGVAHVHAPEQRHDTGTEGR